MVPADVPAAIALENCASVSGGAAGEGRVDHAVERQRRSVGDHRDHVVQRDAILAVGIERELADLAARGLAGRRRSAKPARRGRRARS